MSYYCEGPVTATRTHWSMALGGKQRCCYWFFLKLSILNAEPSLLLYVAKGTVAVVDFTNRIFHCYPWVLCVWACVLGEGGSRRRDVGLMTDTLTPLRLWQGGVVVCDKWVLLLLLLLQWRWRCAAALGELIGQLAKLFWVGQRLQHSVFALQHRVPLMELLDVLLQHLNLLANSIHQVALYQVLKDKIRKTTITTHKNKQTCHLRA